MRPGSVHNGTERPPAGMGRISAPWTRQSARPRWTRRAILTSITGHLLWSGPQGAATPLGRFYIRAPSLFASQWTQRNRNGQCVKPWGSAYGATGGSRSLLPGCFVRWVTHRASERPFRAVYGPHGSPSLGRSGARAAELRPARRLDGVLQGEGGGHPISWGRAGEEDRRGPDRPRARRTPRVWSKTRYRAMRPSYPR